LNHSDVITFHNYNDTTSLVKEINELEKRGRPIICTRIWREFEIAALKHTYPSLKDIIVNCHQLGIRIRKDNTFTSGARPFPTDLNPSFGFMIFLERTERLMTQKKLHLSRTSLHPNSLSC
jgi:hypothetical protein